MKKILSALFAVTLMSGAALAAGEINVKAGMDVMGNGYLQDYDGSFGIKTGLSLSAEYLYPVSGMIKIGAGAEYLVPRNVDVGTEIIGFSGIPLYAAVQLNPFPSDAGLFFKGNIGYLVFTEVYTPWDGYVSPNGNLYFSLGFGYEFDFGLIMDMSYALYYASMDFGDDLDIHYSKAGINVGYKFKL